jgi:hypothetical protein
MKDRKILYSTDKIHQLKEGHEHLQKLQSCHQIVIAKISLQKSKDAD